MKKNQPRTLLQLLDFQPQTRRSMDIFLLNLAEELRSRGWRSIHVFSGEPPESFRARLDELDSPYFVSRFPLSWGGAQKLVRDLRPYRVDIMQTTFMSPFNPLLWWIKMATSSRYWVFTDQTSGVVSPKSGLKLRAWRAHGALANQFIDHVVAVSGFVAERHIGQDIIPKDKIRVIYNGVDTSRFRPAGPNHPREGESTLLFAGQLINEKGLDLLIEAVRRVTQKIGACVNLKIAGVGSQREELERLASKAIPGRYEFLGQVEDMPALFRSADLAVFPSRWEEACAFVLSEALACGTPVIASDAGGIPEVVGLDATSGLIFRKNDVGDLARKIEELLCDNCLRIRMGQAARARVEQNFSINNMVNQYVSMYEEFQVERREEKFCAHLNRGKC